MEGFCVLKLPVLPLRLQPSAGDCGGGFFLSVSGFCCIDSWNKGRILEITRSIGSRSLLRLGKVKD